MSSFAVPDVSSCCDGRREIQASLFHLMQSSFYLKLYYYLFPICVWNFAPQKVRPYKPSRKESEWKINAKIKVCSLSILREEEKESLADWQENRAYHCHWYYCRCIYSVYRESPNAYVESLPQPVYYYQVGWYGHSTVLQCYYCGSANCNFSIYG